MGPCGTPQGACVAHLLLPHCACSGNAWARSLSIWPRVAPLRKPPSATGSHVQDCRSHFSRGDTDLRGVLVNCPGGGGTSSGVRNQFGGLNNSMWPRVRAPGGGADANPTSCAIQGSEPDEASLSRPQQHSATPLRKSHPPVRTRMKNGGTRGPKASRAAASRKLGSGHDSSQGVTLPPPPTAQALFLSAPIFDSDF